MSQDGLPRLQEGFPKAPAEVQDLKKEGSKNTPDLLQFLNQLSEHFSTILGAKTRLKRNLKLDLKKDPPEADRIAPRQGPL